MKLLLKSVSVALFTLSGIASASAQNLDNPLPPVNPLATLSDDFLHVNLSWGYPGDVGENGGRVDPDKITYYIFDAFASYYDPAIAVTQATSYDFDYSSLTGQDFVAYQLTAGMDEIWYSLPVNSNIVCVGLPKALPFSESFASGKQTFPWCVGTDSSPRVTTAISKDDSKPYGEPDNGCLTLTSSAPGQSFSITSVKIATVNTSSLKLQLSTRGNQSALQIEMAADGGEFSEIANVESSDDWLLHTIDIDGIMSAQYIQLRLTSTFQTSKACLAIDDICVSDNQSGAAQFLFSDNCQSVAEYFSIDGHRLPGYPSAPGVYFCRRNNTVKKFVIK